MTGSLWGLPGSADIDDSASTSLLEALGLGHLGEKKTLRQISGQCFLNFQALLLFPRNIFWLGLEVADVNSCIEILFT